VDRTADHRKELNGTSAGADVLYGTPGPDTFDGKGASSGSQDYEQGKGGGDDFIFNQGYGHLEISETDYGSNPSNVLQLGSGISKLQIVVTGDSSGNVYLTDGTSGDQVKLDGELNGPYSGVQWVQFVDGTILTKAQLIAMETTGTSGADNLYGTSGPDTFDGKGAPAARRIMSRGTAAVTSSSSTRATAIWRSARRTSAPVPQHVAARGRDRRSAGGGHRRQLEQPVPDRWQRPGEAR